MLNTLQRKLFIRQVLIRSYNPVRTNQTLVLSIGIYTLFKILQSVLQQISDRIELELNRRGVRFASAEEGQEASSDGGSDSAIGTRPLPPISSHALPAKRRPALHRPFPDLHRL